MSHEMTQMVKDSLKYADDGNYIEMIRVAQRVVQAYPEVPEIHYFLGCCYLKLREYGLAANSFQNAASIKKHIEEEMLLSFYLTH
ncbi:MAG: hypothetical protein R6W72_11355 [Desulfurivibrionaceae bacterium]